MTGIYCTEIRTIGIPLRSIDGDSFVFDHSGVRGSHKNQSRRIRRSKGHGGPRQEFDLREPIFTFKNKEGWLS